MLNLKIFLLSLCFIPVLCFALNAQAAGSESSDKKPLIAYFSRSGHTEAIAEMIHKLVGGELVQIKTVATYPSDYEKCVEQAKQEQQDNARPPIETKINPNDYDVIFLGFPNWWSSMPMPIWTFVEENKLNGKIIIPFMTHGGGGVGHAISDLKKLCPKSKILQPLSISGTQASGAFNQVEKWIKDLALNKIDS